MPTSSPENKVMTITSGLKESFGLQQSTTTSAEVINKLDEHYDDDE